ncbi:choice-of-anchor J domain-containing protein [Mangrovimonas sp. YM274]|uniref:choice-of-anchor J domain-containing protein n=1 Tax=Mangrovimonas sp. YM274 TaxID=3070660 RepID=UPI0027DAC910|nr:choice-of-anchor J domain-containing protein [Mangrovimonas sp. YM274]WMI69013.1 choice-of-anchor J domain-containing protein [Mangrovimonas sp. YM274]
MKNKLQATVAKTALFLRRDFHVDVNSFTGMDLLKGKLKLLLTIGVFFLLSTKGFSQLANESFDSGVPATWTLLDNEVGAAQWGATTDGYLGTNAVSVNPSADNIGDTNTAEYFLVTPQFTVPANGELHFYTKQATDVDNGATYEIRVSTAAQPDIFGFNVTLETYSESDLGTEYEQQIVDLSSIAGVDVYVAFVAVNTQNGAAPTGDEWFIDDAEVLEGCADIATADIDISDLTTEGGLVTWTHPSATNFNLDVVPAGALPDDITTAVDGTSYTITGLEGGMSYDVYVQAVCDNGTVSAWTGPVNFTTNELGLSCDEAIVISDLSEPFILEDNLSNYSNPDIVYDTAGANCISGVPSTWNMLNGDKIFLSYTPEEDGLVNFYQSTATGASAGENCWNAYSTVLIYESCEDVGVTCLDGINTTTSNMNASLEGFLAEAGNTYIIVISSNLTMNAGICFTFEMQGSSCAPPTGIDYSDLTATSVSMSWENVGGFADSWEYAVVPTGDPAPTTGIVATSSLTDNLIDTGLVAGTTYDFYVRSICGGTTGAWANPYTFTTQCETFPVPFYEDFTGVNSSTPEPCWYSINVNEDQFQWGYLTGYPTLPTLDTPGNNNDIYSSPRLNFTDQPKRLVYKHRATNGTSTYSIKLSTTGIGAENFTTEVLPETVITNGAWEEVTVELPIVSGEVNIAWVVTPNPEENATRLSIDDILIENIPTCPQPSDLATGTIQTTTAELTWTAGSDETEWEVMVQAPGAGVPTEPGDFSQPGVVTDQNPYTAEGLNHATHYEYYIRAICGEGDYSEWVGPFEFTTLCESFDVPYFESFNDEDPESYKFCWSVNNANGDNVQWTTLPDMAAVQTSIFAPPTGFDDWFISPAINVNGGLNKLEFDYKVLFSALFPANRFGMEVLISTTDTDPSSFTVLDPLFEITNSNFETKTLYFEADAGTIYVAFRVPPEFDVEDGFSHLHLDNVSIEGADDCQTPTGLFVSGVTGSSANINWSAGYDETAWNVAVQPAGVGLPTNTTATVDETTFTASGLEPGTEYEVYVQASCGDSSSGWVGPVSFVTACNAFDTPFIETFDSDSETEVCWSIPTGGWELDNVNSTYEGDQSAAVFTPQSINDFLITPTINVQPNQRLRFFYRAAYNAGYPDHFKVFMSTSGNDPASMNIELYDSATDGPVNNTSYIEKIINIPLSGELNFGFQIASSGQILIIDNVIVEDIPSCPEPTNVVLSSITDEGFTAIWDSNGSEDSWEIAVIPFEEDAPVGDVDPAYSYIADTNPFTVTGLTEASKYNVYVRAICSDTEKSEWSGPTELNTRCDFDNLCEYTITLIDENYPTFPAVDVYQNGYLVQTLVFYNGDDTFPEYTLFLCTGVEFELYMNTGGWNPDQYANWEVILEDYQGEEVAHITGLPPQQTFYTGIAQCGEVSCPQPTDLTANGAAGFSWTPGGDETQWEVAVQPLENGTLPQSGTVVDTPSYVPTADDFVFDNAGTYEYFVRAICSDGETSYWSGPYDFAVGDDISTAVNLPINEGEDCEEAIVDVTFRNATLSPEALSCGDEVESDIWFEFTATSRVQMFMIDGFENPLHAGTANTVEPFPHITMTLYKELTDGSLEEMGCTFDNLFVASYSTELVVGDNYKLRLSLTTPEVSTRTFKLCATTPNDLCSINAPNGGFENPSGVAFSGSYQNSVDQAVIPGWTQSVVIAESNSSYLFFWETVNNSFFPIYEGGQSVTLIGPDGSQPDDTIKGIYRDFDTSEITQMFYTFAHLPRSTGNTIQLFAGPPEGPYVNIREEAGNVGSWANYSGAYNVPEGQTTTRFIFRNKYSGYGVILDATNFVANNSINTFTNDQLDCTNNSIQMSAEGTGTWISAEDNPGPVLISDASSREVTVSGFTVPGTYTFIWQTRYCDDMVTVEYDGIEESPVVESPIMYCVDEVAEQLTATIEGEYTLLWYTEAVGGTGSEIAPTPDTSVAGTTSYYVGYVDANGCEGPRSEIVVEVNDVTTPTTDFTYEDVYCPDSGTAMPVLSEEFTLGGSFSSQTGLDINTDTGEINVATSTPGEYTITYEIVEDADICLLGGMSTYTVTILDNLTSEISEDCVDASIVLTAAPVGDAYNPDEVEYVWTDASGEVVGENSSTFNVTEYAMNNINATVPTQFMVTVTLGGCSTSASYTVEKFSCGEIPKGISPDGNGKNDTFDLTGFQVVKLSIFNRYGTEVFNFSGSYTNQWGGQTNDGEELPTGTYFYSIETQNGTNETGWVYINRAK